jgi:hypothetical protein
LSDNESFEAPELCIDDPATVAERLKWADAAEALFRRVLVALGYNGEVSTADLINAIAAWLSLFLFVKRDPDGRFASVWLSSFNTAWGTSTMLQPSSRRTEAEEQADAAVLAFAQRFPPLLEDAEQRDTADDLTALREALDEQTEATAAARSIADEWKTSAERLAAQVAHLESQLSRYALVPQPKPDRVEPDQRWARMVTTDQVLDNGNVTEAGIFEFWEARRMMSCENWIYLGNVQKTDG